MERFEEAQKYLESKGFTVINPALVNSNLPPSTTWDQYMEVSLVMLSWCDAIYMLKGWEYSEGANLENRRAKSLRIKIIEEL